MTDPLVLQEMIKQWKKQNKDKLPDLNYEMMNTIMTHINESSPVKVARNPLDKDHDWIPDTVCHNVKNVYIDDEGRLTLRIRKDNTELTVDKLIDQIKKLKTNISRSSVIMVKVSEEKVVQLTDVYSHALVKDSWAGLPFDLVFAYYEEDPSEKKQASEDDAESEAEGEAE